MPVWNGRVGLAKQLHDAWGIFITTGAPTAATGGGLPAWPRYDTATRQTMIFHAEGPYVAADPNGTQRAAWDGRDWQPGTWWPVPGTD